MIKKTSLYKCQVCNNIVEVIREGEGELVCCSKPMILLNENTDDSASIEKHVPVYENGIIKVGSEIHPMNEEHHIEFIEAISHDKKYIIRKFLDINEEPTLDTTYNYCKDSFIMRELCNLHGVWSANKI